MTRLWTAIVVPIAVCTGVVLTVLGVRFLAQMNGLGVLLLPCGIACLGAVAVAFMYAPLQYAICRSGITIRRRASDLFLPIETIETAAVARRKEFGRVIRTFGFGGAFGCWGWCRSSAISAFEGYCTRFDVVVLLARRGRHPLVLSPDAPDRFVAVLQELLSEPAHKPDADGPH